MKNIFRILIVMGITLSGVIQAAEYPGAFKISAIFMSGPTNFHFRVISNNPGAWHCHNGPKNPSWSYINENDPGSKGMMSALMAAYVAKKTVKVVTQGVDTPAGHMCHIIEFQISE
ncbi:hypothetical protein [Vibrio spartinae]|uniref:Uncharacterized protein n=1 Tax=Vibrio spartinae TaxID=1918945 RepID=A0A1N6LZ42_9VIBR|nr:hypothetical protein [Vibrio spartinae]QMV16525.1 hypothetical protein Vspart_03919 [Vibrio spartinae]SIO92401.1 hypothetical protein VSP9026_00010 [Vibrio spartinae]